MGVIKKIVSSEILDSRGIPTLSTRVFLADGIVGECSVPSGTSVSSYEAVELRDKDRKRFSGLGVLKAVSNVNDIINKSLIGEKVFAQKKIDDILLELDGTENKARLGANAILSVSLAVSVAASISKKLPLFVYLRQLYGLKSDQYRLPIPMVNIINGGKHVDKGLDFQEFLLVPKAKNSFKDKVSQINKVIETLKKLIHQNRLTFRQGLEGGFSLGSYTNEQAIEILEEAVKQSGFTKDDFGISIDAAASSFFRHGNYVINDLPYPLGSEQFMGFLEKLARSHSLLSIEDPLHEEDWENWKIITKALSPKTLIIGDDFISTNEKRLDKALTQVAVSGVIVKPNQIGTLSETLSFVSKAASSNLKIIVSNRSGETQDTFIADLAVAVNADFIKAGSPLRPERLVKYKRLLEIENLLINYQR